MTDNIDLPRWSDDGRKRVLVLSSTPRREGNSRRLAEAALEGAAAAGHETIFVHLADHITGFLRDCRQCRGPDGTCAIDDRHRQIFLDLYVPADAVIYASPIWWYGISGLLKAFLDRMFCYLSESYPGFDEVIGAVQDKRVGVVLSAEESNLSARLGIASQFGELCRYLDHMMVGIVVGIGNSRSEVLKDPLDPAASARELGAQIFEIEATDYQLKTERTKRIWDEGAPPYPGRWR